jgi:paraquat-inducible protein B
MSKKTSPTLIGIFTLAGLLLAAAALVLFGAGKFFEKSSNILLYFDRSANGLLVGSEVRFGGVRIGRVTSIKVLIDPQRNRKIIPVVVQLSAKDLAAVGSTSGDGIDFATESGVRKAVAEGLRARMKQQSLLTGQLYVEFDIVPDGPFFVYQPGARTPFPTVPTISTEMDELISGIADGLKKFNNLNLDGVVKELREVIANTKSQIADLDLKTINDNLVGITGDVRALAANKKLAVAIDSLDEALRGIDALTKKASQGIDPMIKDLGKVIEQTQAGLVKIDGAAADLSKITNPRGPVLLRLHNVLDEAERGTRTLKELADDLKRNPNTILLGKDHKP